MPAESTLSDLTAIFNAALMSVDPITLLPYHLSREGSTLAATAGDNVHNIDLDQINSLYVIGAGKATARMALAAESLLGDRITDGVISVKYGFTETLEIINTIEAGHPIPDEAGLAAAESILKIADKAGKDDLVISLISGGGSALLTSPQSVALRDKPLCLSLQDKRQLTNLLIKSGASIHEINCVRKHLSTIKGGRLAERIYPARLICLILSDVIGNQLDVIASGPTVPDTSTFQMSGQILERYQLKDLVTKNVREILEAGSMGEIPETPKPDSAVFKKVRNIIIGDNDTCLSAAYRKAAELGYHSEIIKPELTGEASIAAEKIYFDVKRYASQSSDDAKPACLIFGGETTVTVKGDGKGGRAQELALAYLNLARKEKQEHRSFLLSASTDGNDGPTDAAGAFVSSQTLQKSIDKGLDPDKYLRRNDSYSFFRQTDSLFRTGPSNTNVCDIQIVILPHYP